MIAGVVGNRSITVHLPDALKRPKKETVDRKTFPLVRSAKRIHVARLDGRVARYFLSSRASLEMSHSPANIESGAGSSLSLSRKVHSDTLDVNLDRCLKIQWSLLAPSASTYSVRRVPVAECGTVSQVVSGAPARSSTDSHDSCGPASTPCTTPVTNEPDGTFP